MKPRNALHVVRYIRRSGLSLVAQAVLAQLACETNGANGETRIATADLALDIGTSTRQIERALTELRERGILASSGRGTGRVLAIRDQAVAPGYPMANPPTNPPPVADPPTY